MKTLFLFFILSNFIYAETLFGTVTKVMDGDTISVSNNEREYKIRLLHIDAPEKRQEHGLASKEALSKKILNQKVRIEYTEQDFYRRILGDVFVGSRWINRELVLEGLVWQNREYSNLLIEEEKEARFKKVGLWHNKTQIAPWIWRIDEQIKMLVEKRKKLLKMYD